MFYRGTTPTLSFHLPFECSHITKLNIAFSQNDDVVIEKTLNDCTCSGRKIAITLSESETLSLNSKKEVEIQIRVGIGDKRLTSNIMKTTVGRILKEGAL